MIGKIGVGSKQVVFDDSALSEHKAYNTIRLRPLLLTKPTGFTLSRPISIYDEGNGNYKISHTVDDLFPRLSGVTYYVDPVNGLDTNDGLTWQTAFKKISKADGMADVAIVMLKSGIYGSVLHSWTTLRDKDIKYISEANQPPAIIFPGWPASYKTWTDMTGYFQASTFGTVNNVFDTTQKQAEMNYELTKLTLVASEAEVPLLANSYYVDTENSLININVGRMPDANVLCCTSLGILTVSQTSFTGERHVCFENINFIFRLAFVIDSPNKLNIYGKNLRIGFSTNTDGLGITGNVFSYMENCISQNNYNDGFNYHGVGDYNPEFIEVNCIGRSNGYGNNTGINNGSTCHESGKGIRLNGIYHNNEGRNVHDINISQTWNVNCYAFNSVATTGDAAKEDFAVWDTAKMWNYKCTAYGASVINAEAQATAHMYNKVCDFDRASGLMETY